MFDRYRASDGENETILQMSGVPATAAQQSGPTQCCVCVLRHPLCPSLCDPVDCSLPGSSVHGILQARILEWAAMPSRLSSQPRDGTRVSCTGGWVLHHCTTWEAPAECC